MAFYVQYNAVGDISTILDPDREPDVDEITKWQIQYPAWFDTTGKMIDIATKQLVDIPPTE